MASCSWLCTEVLSIRGEPIYPAHLLSSRGGGGAGGGHYGQVNTVNWPVRARAKPAFGVEKTVIMVNLPRILVLALV
jgi:hypothetical protein